MNLRWSQVVQIVCKWAAWPEIKDDMQNATEWILQWVKTGQNPPGLLYIFGGIAYHLCFIIIIIFRLFFLSCRFFFPFFLYSPEGKMSGLKQRGFKPWQLLFVRWNGIYRCWHYYDHFRSDLRFSFFFPLSFRGRGKGEIGQSSRKIAGIITSIWLPTTPRPGSLPNGNHELQHPVNVWRRGGGRERERTGWGVRGVRGVVGFSTPLLMCFSIITIFCLFLFFCLFLCHCFRFWSLSIPRWSLHIPGFPSLAHLAKYPITFQLKFRSLTPRKHPGLLEISIPSAPIFTNSKPIR